MNTIVYQIIKVEQGPDERPIVVSMSSGESAQRIIELSNAHTKVTESAIRPESPNLARGQGGGNESPLQNQEEKEASARSEMRPTIRGWSYGRNR